MIKAAFIGFGSIAHVAHLPAYLELEKEGKVKLVAVCDVREDQFAAQEMQNNMSSSSCAIGADVHTYTDWQEMLQKEDIDMVDICVPTFLHADIATKVLKAGHNVLCEKPMSYTYSLCEQMIAAAKESGKQLMIGQCLRFSAHYNYLKKLVDEGTYGKVLGGVFHRLSAPPTWGWENWYMDYTKAQGAITDLHIHDIDMIRYLFGEPQAVSCNTMDICSKKDSAFSTLYYDGFTMHAVGDWSLEGMPFAADFRVSFEKATVAFAGGEITVYPRGGEAFVAPVTDGSFYTNEIRFFVEHLLSGEENTVNSPESAAGTIRLIEALIASSDNGGARLPYAE